MLTTRELLNKSGCTSLSRGLVRALGIILSCGLLAFLLLKLGQGVSVSLGAAACVGLLFLAWSRLTAAAHAIARTAARLGATATRIISDRSTYRFRLSTLLLAILFLAVVCAWYGNRMDARRLEQRRLAGKWRMLNLKGTPLVLNGSPVISDLEQAFRDGSCTIDPAHDPKWIDFHTPTGTSRGIYRWEGERLRLRQVSENSLRPVTFDSQEQTAVDPSFPPGPGGLWQTSRSDWLLERVSEK